MRYNMDTHKDAGKLREYFASRYGEYATFGGTLATAERANSVARRLAKLSGLTMDRVFTDARSAYAAS